MATATKEISIVSVVNLVTQVSQTIDFINDVGHLGELKNTMNTLVGALMPYLDVEKHDTVFYICTHGLIQSLTNLKQILVEAYDLQPPAESRCNLSFPTWNCTFLPALRCSSNSSQKGISHERKVELYRTDFLINHKILQFNALFPPHACSGTVDSLISNPEAKLFWTMCFSDKAVMVPWKTFFAAFEKYLHVCLQAEEEYFKNFLDFTQDNFVSAWEFSVFMKWFGPIKGCHTRLMEPVNNGILAGFIPACEATNLLQGRECGTFLVRLSKSHLDSFAITFVDHQLQTRHCLLYCAHPHGLTLNSPPNIYPSLMEFIRSHPQKLKHPLGKLIVSVSCKSRVKTCYRPSSPGKEPPLIFSPSSTTSYGEDLTACAPSGYINTSEPVPPSAPASFSSTFLPSAFCNCEQSQTTVTTLPDEAGLNILRKPSSNLSPKECSSESCVVCLDAPSETVFLECAHMCCCKICSVKLKQCPVCRADIVRIIPVFRT